MNRSLASLSLKFLRENRPSLKKRVILFSHAGGSATTFVSWSKHFGQDVEVIAIELPGHGRRLSEPLSLSITALATQIARDLESLTAVPTAFCGHSMGALVAYETAHRLQDTPLVHLTLCGAKSPGTTHPNPTKTLVAQMSPAQFLTHLRTFGGTPEAFFAHQELLDLLVPVVRADLIACERYSHQQGRPLLHVPMTIFGGRDDQGVPPDTLSGWTELTTASCEHVMLSGGHFFLHEHALTIATQIQNAFGHSLNVDQTPHNA